VKRENGHVREELCREKEINGTLMGENDELKVVIEKLERDMLKLEERNRMLESNLPDNVLVIRKSTDTLVYLPCN